MQCKWCGIERDAPAAGPHVCDPQRVHERATEEAALHIERHSCVSSCCDAQPGAGEAVALAQCVRAHGQRVADNPTASWTVGEFEPATWGVFDTWDRRWCPRRGTEEAMGRHAVRLNGEARREAGVSERPYRYQPLPLPASVGTKSGA